jgi:hypothetical protein
MDLAMDRPVILVTTEHGPTEVIGFLRERGLGELPPNALSFIDAFGETVGVADRKAARHREERQLRRPEQHQYGYRQAAGENWQA